MRYGSQEVTDTFLDTRCANLSSAWGSHFGTLAMSIDKAAAWRIVERAIVAS
ncbi:hypothetical protein LOKO_00585 [Halomonas chromatireducens]|uniref:Uncharacterized protein n=1 Tax=Halomonas chromatireducens TaxID=507626 RepID=A0A109UKY1_9GAMM|nr:hypothetical protein LOKO_00585 [Halomonas chromatireducens]